MPTINDVECKSANDLKTILKADNKETPNDCSMRQLHTKPQLSQIESEQAIGMLGHLKGKLPATLESAKQLCRNFWHDIKGQGQQMIVFSARPAKGENPSSGQQHPSGAPQGSFPSMHSDSS